MCAGVDDWGGQGLRDGTQGRRGWNASQRCRWALLLFVGLCGFVAELPVAASLDPFAPETRRLANTAAPSPSAILASGVEVLLRIVGKNDLCLHDGGGLKKNETKLIPFPCNAFDSNETFVYNASTSQLRSSRKTNLCVDDGGTTVSGAVLLIMNDCSTSSTNQRFVYDDATQMIRNPAKNNLCLDDGGAVRASGSQFTLKTCNATSPNQHFEVLVRATRQAQQQRVLDVVAGGARFTMRASGKSNLCSEGPKGTTGANIRLDGCSTAIWVYLASSKQLLSFIGANMCLDDGASTTGAGAYLRYMPCNAASKDQKFAYDATLQRWYNPSKINLCVSDGDVWTTGSGILMRMAACNALSSSQLFTSQLQYSVPDPSPALQTTGGVMLRLPGPRALCVDARIDPIVLFPCNPSNPSQLFQYNTTYGQLRSIAQPTMCLTGWDDYRDGQGWGDWIGHLNLTSCQIYSRYQVFMYNETIQQLKCVYCDAPCLKRGSIFTKLQGAAVQTTSCYPWIDEQRVEIVSVPDVLAEQTRVVNAVTGGAKFRIVWNGQLDANPNLCADIGSLPANGGRFALLNKCMIGNEYQIWTWDAKVSRFRSGKNPAMCLDDGGSPPLTNLAISTCNATSKNQAIVYTAAVQSFANVNKKLCVWSSSEKMGMAACNPRNLSYLYDLDLVSPITTYTTPSLLQSKREFLLRLQDRPTLCLDDGGGTSENATSVTMFACNPNSANQALIYNATTNQLQSARKPTLCVDKGIADPLGRVVMAVCNVDSAAQQFVYNETSQQFKNPVYQVCLQAGISATKQVTTGTCDATNVNQRWEIMFTDVWLAQLQRDSVAVAGGAVFLIQGNGVGMCVDDNTPAAAFVSTMTTMPCTATRLSQLYRWDATLKRIRRYNLPSLCLDIGETTGARLSPCDTTNANQDLAFNVAAQRLKNTKKNLCVVSNVNSTRALSIQPCNDYNLYQVFISAPAPVLQAYATPSSVPIGPSLLRIRDKDTPCITVRGLIVGDLRAIPFPCDPSSADQFFLYDPATNQIRSGKDPRQCLDGNGAITLSECNVYSVNQRFVYDTTTQILRSPNTNVCVVYNTVIALFTTARCDWASPIEFKLLADWLVEQQAVLDAVASGAKSMISLLSMGNMCLDMTSSPIHTGTVLTMLGCNSIRLTRIWQFDPSIRRIRSAADPSLCLDTGTGWVRYYTDRSPNEGYLQLWPCDASNPKQEFVYDKTQQSWKNPSNAALCVDYSFFTSGIVQVMMKMAPCDPNKPKQRFAFVLAPPPLPVLATPAVLQTSRKFQLRVRGAVDVCVDDGGGGAASQITFVTCNLNEPRQLFTYDQSINGLLSARTGLCLSDAGVNLSDQLSMLVLDCNPYNVDLQFVYSATTRQFRNPNKDNLCIDVGGSKYPHHLWEVRLQTCDAQRPSQRLDIAFIDDLLVQQQQVQQQVEAGATFQIRWNALSNLCVTDMTESGSLDLLMLPCDAQSTSQWWAWDATTSRFHSATQPGRCLVSYPEVDSMAVASCDATDPTQAFVYDHPMQRLSRRDLESKYICAQTYYHTPTSYYLFVRPCFKNSEQQQFELVLVPPLTTT